ncbi:hypothetical protein EsDP_00004242 [Epichloe bromicola]|uniref:SCP domain-containing protein n=1 Tax=Epichloe bromicola TaxID=79588 RepID=A0ABQ0CR63_9HYPO
MKSSLFLVATSALLASAGPLRKRAKVTNWVTEFYTVTVTDDGSAPTPAIFVEDSKNAPPPAVVVPELPPKVVNVVNNPAPTQPPPPPPPAPKPKAKAPEPKAKAAVVKTPEVKVPEVKPEAPKKSQAPAPTTNNVNDYQKIVIEKHNLVRENHRVAGLEWDDTLAQYATNTANGCVFQHDMKQGSGGYGQNLASQGSSGDIDNLKDKSVAQAIINQWYKGEVNDYNLSYGMSNPNVNLGRIGHFTQVVWKSTKKVGCATVKCPAGSIFGMPSWYTVCNYQPAGNFGGEYGKNVLQPLGLSISVV